jgi:two-component system, OmpR family, alkaline phosphatase synthesis response regulator PhoP
MATKKYNLLLVEDEENLHATLKLNFEIEGYEITSAFTGSEALTAIEKEHFDIIVLDVMLPEIDGITVTEKIRLQKNETPILILSAKGLSSDRILGLKKGANDYLNKPFNLEELLLRIDKLVDKTQSQTTTNHVGDVYCFGANTIHFKAQEAINFREEKIPLTKKEIMLLQLLIENKNEVVTREKILQLVWGYQVYPTTRTIDNFILCFRKYFEKDTKNAQHFYSVRGVGYKFIP